MECKRRMLVHFWDGFSGRLMGVAEVVNGFPSKYF